MTKEFATTVDIGITAYAWASGESEDEARLKICAMLDEYLKSIQPRGEEDGTGFEIENAGYDYPFKMKEI